MHFKGNLLYLLAAHYRNFAQQKRYFYRLNEQFVPNRAGDIIFSTRDLIRSSASDDATQQVSFASHKSQVAGHRSHQNQKALSNTRDVRIA